LMQRALRMEQSRLFLLKTEVAALSQAKILYELRVATTAITDSKSCCTVLLAACIAVSLFSALPFAADNRFS